MKRIWRFFSLIILILIIIGVILGVYLHINKSKINSDESIKNIFSKVQTKQADVTEFFTYGTSLNISCKISGIDKDNYESARLIITDGKNFENMYKLYTDFEENNLVLTTSNYINDAVDLDELDKGKYYFLIRLKLNNSSSEKYYLLKNISNYDNIEYYTISQNGENQKVTLESNSYEYNKNHYNYIKLNKENTNLPDDVYDIVIDAGHGGDDSGEKYNGYSEANITLDYANTLKEQLEKKNLKVKLTRTNENTDSYKEKNTYDSDGRITSACSSKAKYMISLHINNGNESFSGVEVYAPCKSNLEFAKNLVKNITEKTTIEISNVGKYKVQDGVYVRNFSNIEIKNYANTAIKNGYENYNITSDTPFLYTIREVGGIATNAFVDGRNKRYSANKYYNSNQGIECYQLELGYIKKDIDKIENEKSEYIQAIVDSIISEIN